MVLDLDSTRPRERILADVESLVKDFDGVAGHIVALAGAPVAQTALTEHILRELQRTLPLVIAIVGLLLYLCLGSVMGTLVPLTEVLVTVTWTAGLMALTNRPIFLPSTIIPAVLISTGACDEIYLFAGYVATAARNFEMT
jgi:predicted RND superfamily exporter protein